MKKYINKKFLKILLMNIFLIVLFCFLFEILMYMGIGKVGGWYQKDYTNRPDFSLEQIGKKETGYYFRKPCGLEYKKRPILLYGCSYTYGYGLKDNEHFGYVLSQYTKRPVYNFSLFAKGIQHALYIMQNYPKIEPEPEYIIYTYCNFHIRRLYMEVCFLNPFNFLSYEYQNGQFLPKEDKIKYLRNTMLFQSIMFKIVFPLIKEEDKYNLFKTYLKEMKKEIDKKYPNAKFVIVWYDRSDRQYIDLSNDRIKEIKDLGIDIIDLDEFFGNKLYQKEYQLPDWHPNTKAWELVVPKIAEIEKM